MMDQLLKIEHSIQLIRTSIVTATSISTEQEQCLYQVAVQVERAEKQFQRGFTRKWEEGELAPQKRPTVVDGVAID